MKPPPVGKGRLFLLALAAGLVLAVLLLSVLQIGRTYSSIQASKDLPAESETAFEDVRLKREESLQQRIDQIETTAQTAIDRLARTGSTPTEAELQRAVKTADFVVNAPAVTDIILQDRFAGLTAVDAAGVTADVAVIAAYDASLALDRPATEPFVTRTPADALFAHYPIGGSTQAWLVLLVDAVELVDGATLVSEAATPAAPLRRSGSDIVMRSTAQFGDLEFSSDFVAEDAAPSAKGWMALALTAVISGFALVAAIAIFRALLNSKGAKKRKPDSHLGASVGFEQTIVGVVELDESGVIVDVNQAYCTQVGKTREEVVGSSLLSLTATSDRPRHLAALDKVISGGQQTMQVEHRLEMPPPGRDEEVWVLEHLSRRYTDSGLRILCQSQDITFRRYATWELAKQALHDELTGLPNRAMLVHRLRSALERRPEDEDEAAPGLVGVMFIDVDRFKKVNDSLGHDVGDRLIKHVGKRMQTAVRVGDTVSRFGGDEFVVLCERVESVSEMMAVAERVRSSVADPFVDSGATIHQTLSIGIAVSDPAANTADELLQNADAAMYRAKQRGRNRAEVFDDGMRQALVEQMSLEAELREAIDKEEVEMFFQPIVDSTNYATAGFEALIRWNHPERGLLSPGEFLPIAEDAGLQGRLDHVALKLTCQQMARWAARYPMANEMYVSANKVPRNFPQFLQQIREIVAMTGLPPGLLVIEVVENALIDDAAGALAAIEALKEMGIRVAIDDFGTGYSSLSYLTQFKPTTLKIDRAFVSLLPQDTATASVVRAITDMSLALDINVVAEGVETWEQAECLHRMGVPYFQGYLFAKPRPASQIEAWFASNSGVSPDPGGTPAPIRHTGIEAGV